MLTGFTASLLLITVSELGDKTFFIAAILSVKHSRLLVFLGASLALVAMTVVSVLLGRVVSLLPQIYVHWAEVVLFAVFGIKLWYSAFKMSSQEGEESEEEEAMEVIEAAEKRLPKQQKNFTIIAEAFTLTFLGEWGDRTQLATIALAAAHSPLAVIAGASLGHMTSTLLAVRGGRILLRYVSEKILTYIGGSLFIFFSIIAFWENIIAR